MSELTTPDLQYQPNLQAELALRFIKQQLIQPDQELCQYNNAYDEILQAIRFGRLPASIIFFSNVATGL